MMKLKSMKEKCPDIDTSSKTIEIDTKTENYHDLDILSLEKQYEKRKKEYEKERKKNKNKDFKKMEISNDKSNSKKESEYEKSHKRSIYQIEEPCYETYLGLIIAFIIIIILIIIIVIYISVHFSKNNLTNTDNEKNFYKTIYLNHRYHTIFGLHNFTKEELSNINVRNLSDQLYIDLCLQGILINKNLSNYHISETPKISVIKPIFNNNFSLNYLNYSLRSIQNQNLTDIEIIIIDDASNDNNQTANLVKKFQEEDPRIKLLMKMKKVYYILYAEEY